MKYNEYMVLMNPSRPQGEGKGGEVRWMTCCETPELKEAIGWSVGQRRRERGWIERLNTCVLLGLNVPI